MKQEFLAQANRRLGLDECVEGDFQILLFGTETQGRFDQGASDAARRACFATRNRRISPTSGS